MRTLLLKFLTRKVFTLLERAADCPGVASDAPSIETSRQLAQQLLNS